ncbi:MAG: lysophospholipid acyltransferase family protein [Myxococcota bacterium]
MLRSLGSAILKTTGWRVSGGPPPARRYVLVAAPHTSNWDLLYMLAIAAATDVEVRWIGKHTLFRGPLGVLLRRLGGIPIDRRAPRGLVDQMAHLFAEADDLVLAIPPEGTRARRDHWKSGFYHIARAADVPVALTYLDYERKEGGFGPAVRLTGDMRADMDRIRAFYADKRGKHPERESTVRLKGEDHKGEDQSE